MGALNRCRRSLLPAWTVFVLFGSGCAEFDDPYQPEVPAGRIEGRVTTGATPVEATIELDRVTGSYHESLILRPEVDVLGNFGMDVPAGDYVAYLRMDGVSERIVHALPAPRYVFARRDTFTLSAANSPVRIDFALGSLSLDLSLPPALDGRKGTLEIFLVWNDGEATALRRVAYYTSDIVGGRIPPRQIPLLPGDYAVKFTIFDPDAWNHAYTCEPVWLPGTRDSAAATRYSVSANEVSLVACASVLEPLRVGGRIAGAWLDLGVGNDLMLSAADLDSTILINRLRVGADGGFNFDLLLPASFKLLSSHGFGIQHWFGGPSFAAADIFMIDSGQTLTGIELLQCGLVFDVDAPLPDPGSAVFRLYDPVDLTLLAEMSDSLMSSRQAIYNLWPGTYLLHIESWLTGAAWAPQWYDRAGAPADALPIVIGNPGDIVAVDVFLELGGVITGHLDSPATPVSPCIVFVHDADLGDERGLDYLVTGETEFTIRGLPDGRYKLGAVTSEQYFGTTDRPPAGAVWHPSTPDWNAAGIIEIIGASTVSGVDIVIPGAGPS